MLTPELNKLRKILKYNNEEELDSNKLLEELEYLYMLGPKEDVLLESLSTSSGRCLVCGRPIP